MIYLTTSLSHQLFGYVTSMWEPCQLLIKRNSPLHHIQHSSITNCYILANISISHASKHVNWTCWQICQSAMSIYHISYPHQHYQTYQFVASTTWFATLFYKLLCQHVFYQIRFYTMALTWHNNLLYRLLIKLLNQLLIYHISF